MTDEVEGREKKGLELLDDEALADIITGSFDDDGRLMHTGRIALEELNRRHIR